MQTNNIDSFGFLSKKLARYYEAEMACVKSYIPKSPKVLEVGYGRGSFLQFGKQMLWDITGVEINQDLVDEAKTNNYNVIAARDLNGLKANDFDLVCAFDVFEHIDAEEIHDYVMSLKRLLKPGGIILAKFPNGDSPLGMPNQNGDLTHKIAIGSGIIHDLAKSSNMHLVLLKGNAEPFLGLGLINFIYRLIIYPTRFILNILFNMIFSANNRVNFCASNLVVVLKK